MAWRVCRAAALPHRN
uniref:Uncharacterized protein n=1 Tax=Anguilla anguilla TaxID=7936 RepID=A0A0E9VQL1_ANGAN